MKVAVIGNGALGLFTAARFIQSNKCSSVTIYGDNSRNYSASSAAGLMINILSEVDAISIHMPLTQWKVSNWRLATEAWDSCFGPNGSISFSNPYTSFGTKVQLDPDSRNSLEKLSFDVLSDTAESVDATQKHSSGSIVNLPFEHSVDSRYILGVLDQYVAKYAFVLNSTVSRVESHQRGLYVYTSESQSPIYYDRVVLSAGSFTESIIENSDINFRPKVKSLYGIGSALEIFSEFKYLPDLSLKSISRTPNRGGTCGLHLVQRTNSIYVGASSFVSPLPSKYPRVSSIHSLLSGALNEFDIGDCLRHSFTTCTGYRPVTQDAVPVMGPISDCLFLMYGHKRDGFTWAPYLSTIASDWLTDRGYTDTASNYLQITNPTRDMIAFADHKKSLELYLLNEQFSRYQHGESFSDSERDALVSRFNQLHSAGTYTAAASHPELVNVNFLLSNSLS